MSQFKSFEENGKITVLVVWDPKSPEVEEQGLVSTESPDVTLISKTQWVHSWLRIIEVYVHPSVCVQLSAGCGRSCLFPG
jgi:hypothetical protein